MSGNAEAFIGSIDQGTTSSRFLIFDSDGQPVAQHQIEFDQIYPHPGWHEQDPEVILSSVEKCIEAAVTAFEKDGKRSHKSIVSVGVTSQRETTLVWDRETGEALHNAVAWPDTRTSSIVRELKAKEGADKLTDICGLPLSTYPSAVKLVWLLRNVDKVKDAYEKGKLAFGTIDTWLLFRLNGGVSGGQEGKGGVFVSDATNASRTMFMDLHTLKYSDGALAFFGIDRSKIALPEIVPCSSAAAFGKLAAGPLASVPIHGCLGDQSAALVGQCGFSAGEAKNTYGTGCFLLYNVGERPVLSRHGLLATVAYHLGEAGAPAYALEGSIAVAGSGVKFLADNFGFAASAAGVSAMAAEVRDSGGCVFVTAFSGLFAPYWIGDARGTLLGLTAHSRAAHVARACLEATCFQTKAILDAMEKDSGKELAALKVDGGMSASDLAMQIQADIIRIEVDRPAMRETTSLGAAIAAGLAAGVWGEGAKGFEEMKKRVFGKEGRTKFTAKISQEESDKMFKRWSKAVEMSKGWVEEEEEQ